MLSGGSAIGSFLEVGFLVGFYTNWAHAARKKKTQKRRVGERERERAVLAGPRQASGPVWF